MYCNKCGHEIKKENKFCQNCGNQIEAIEGEIVDNIRVSTKKEPFKDKFFSFSGGILLLLLFIGLGVGTILILTGTAEAVTKNIDVLFTVNGYATALCLFIFVPFSFFNMTRKISAYGLLYGSYVIGLTIWLYGLAVTYTLWGGFWIFIGLLMWGIGVVPLGIIAAIFNGLWTVVWNLLYGVVLVYGFRLYGAHLADKIEQKQYI